MTYNEMLEVNLLEMKSEIEDLEKKLLEDSKVEDLIKYVNYLRFTQYNCGSIKKMAIISAFLNSEGFKQFEREHSDIVFGEMEDLFLDEEIETVEEIKENQITVDDETVTVVAQFQDNFETILITKDDILYQKFGVIDNEGNNKFIYELPIETDDFSANLISAKIGDKANIFSHFDTNAKIITKTFTKVDLDIDYEYAKVRKTHEGVISNMLSGIYLTLKMETLIQPSSEFIEDKKESTEPDKKSLSIPIQPKIPLVSDYGQNTQDHIYSSDKPVDIVVFGNYDLEDVIEINDDELDVTLRHNDVDYSLNCPGVLSVMTVKDFLSKVNNGIIRIEDIFVDWYDIYIIKNFSGDIQYYSEIDGVKMKIQKDNYDTYYNISQKYDDYDNIDFVYETSGNGNVANLTESMYQDLEINYNREKKFENILSKTNEHTYKVGTFGNNEEIFFEGNLVQISSFILREWNNKAIPKMIVKNDFESIVADDIQKLIDTNIKYLYHMGYLMKKI